MRKLKPRQAGSQKAVQKAAQKAGQEANQEAAQKAAQKANQEAGQEANQEATQKAVQKANQEAGQEANQQASRGAGFDMLRPPHRCRNCLSLSRASLGPGPTTTAAERSLSISLDGSPTEPGARPTLVTSAADARSLAAAAAPE